MTRAVFLDRDGTLNALIYYPDTGENESPRTSEALIMLPGVGKALRSLLAQNWQLFLVSNQPSFAKGKTTLEDLQAVHHNMIDQLTAEGVVFRACYYSYAHPDGVVPAYTYDDLDRKPHPGMLYKAAQEHHVDLRRSWLIGDQDSDILCGQQAHCKTILLHYPMSSTKRGKSLPDWQCSAVDEAVAFILKEDANT